MELFWLKYDRFRGSIVISLTQLSREAHVFSDKPNLKVSNSITADRTNKILGTKDYCLSEGNRAKVKYLI